MPRTCQDYRGAKVVLDDSHERHIGRVHPDATPYLDRLCEALEDPSLVCFRERTGASLYYRSGLTRGSHRLLYFVVVVAFDSLAALDW